MDALERFTQRLVESDYRPNINRYEPMPAQDVFHRAQTKNRVIMGGNRGGKSFSSVADDCWTILRRHPYRQHLYADRPLRGRFVTTDFPTIETNALPLFSQFLPPSALVNGAWEDSYARQARILTLSDGSTISFMSYEQDPDKFQAVWLDFIHFDEEPPKPIFEESMLRLLDTGGTWCMSQTPVQQSEWIQDEIVEPAMHGKRTDVAVFSLDTRLNIHLSSEAVEQIGAGLSEEQKRIRFEGQYLSGSLVFPEFSLNYPNVIDRGEFMQRLRADIDRWRIFESMDYGYSNPTAWLWTAAHEDGSIVTFDAMYQANVIVGEWAARVHQKRSEIARELGLMSLPVAATVGDPAISQNNQGVSGTTVQQAYALSGIHIGTDGIAKVRATNQNVGLDKMHTYLRFRPASAGASASTGQEQEPWWQVAVREPDRSAPDTIHLISEMKRARKPKQTANQKEVKNQSEQIRDKDNHAIDAQKYLFMVTHDLRPVHLRDDTGGIPFEVLQHAKPSPPPPVSHNDAFRARMSSHLDAAIGDDYANLEA